MAELSDPDAHCEHDQRWGFCCHFPLPLDYANGNACTWCGSAVYHCQDGSVRTKRGAIGCEAREGLRHDLPPRGPDPLGRAHEGPPPG